MPKFRSRTIVNAIQWFPGTDIEGVVKAEGNRAFIYFEGGFAFLGSAHWQEIEPGDYLLLAPTEKKMRAVSRIKQNEFEQSYEDIGG